MDADAIAAAQIAHRDTSASCWRICSAVSPGFDEWLLVERTKFTNITARVLRRLVTTHLAAGDFAAAVEIASRLVRLDALDEAAHRLLIECLAQAGQRAEALHQFETCARILREELDIAPDAGTVAVMEARPRLEHWPPRLCG